MSATLQGNTFGEYFRLPSEPAAAQPIFVGAKRFEVEEIYLDEIPEKIPGFADDMVMRNNVTKATKSTLAALSKVQGMDVQRAKSISNISMDVALRVAQRLATPSRTVLIFLPGKREIEQMLQMFQMELTGRSTPRQKAGGGGVGGRDRGAAPAFEDSRAVPFGFPSSNFASMNDDDDESLAGAAAAAAGPGAASALLPSFGGITFGVLHSEVPQDIQRATLLPPEEARASPTCPPASHSPARAVLSLRRVST